jgi:2-oxoisovalerate ferredoxin oxidoreductase alpha subunit
MGLKLTLTGNHASSYGAKLARVDVIAAYPITPQTTVVEKIAEFVADGLMDCEYIKVESEHSAMAACIAAAQTGARTFTATSAHGLTLMHEMLIWASGARLPIVMTNVNRAMAPPWSIWADHLDSIAQRDTGWMQIYCETNQEVLDSVLLAYKVAESKEVNLPMMLNLDAFYLSHTIERVDVPEQELVDSFLPRRKPLYKLDVDAPCFVGTIALPEQFYMEWRYKIHQAFESAKKRIIEVDREFEETFGRSHGTLLDLYRCDDAEVVLIGAGTIVSTARGVVDELRAEGRRVGLARLRVFRPFPAEELKALASATEVLGVMDRAYTFGDAGPFCTEIKGVLYDIEPQPLIKNYIIGIGGRDVTPKHIRDLYMNLYKIKANKKVDKLVEWYGLKY